jgi:hypothetical protein
MISAWFAIFEALVLLVLMCLSCRICYFWGIQDGAFNHHLPIVRREMMVCNMERALEIFEAEDGPVKPVKFKDEAFNGG